MAIRNNFGGYSVLSVPMTAAIRSAIQNSLTNRFRSLFDRPVGRPADYPEFDMLHPGLLHQILNELDALNDGLVSTATA